MKTGNPYVDALSELPTVRAFSKLPITWFSAPEFRREKGALYIWPMLILADVMFWYSPDIRRDEFTNKPISSKQRFAADKWRQSYAELADKYGLSKKQVMLAVQWLKEKGLVDCEFRHSRAASNVLYVTPVVEAIKRVTFPDTIPPKTPTPSLSLRSNMGQMERGISPCRARSSIPRGRPMSPCRAIRIQRRQQRRLQRKKQRAKIRTHSSRKRRLSLLNRVRDLKR